MWRTIDGIVLCCRNRYVAFVRHAAYQFQQLQLLKQSKNKDKETEATPDIKIKVLVLPECYLV